MGTYEFQGTPTPPAQYGSLTITSTPAGAKIFLNSTDTGSVTTRTFTNISTGSHTIKLTLSGYQDWYGTVAVIVGSTTYVYATLTLTPITITSIFHNATGPLKAGNTLTVTLLGVANGIATFDIGTFTVGQQMIQVSSGTYTGS
ncbi:MAG: PEGA domain-containing protein [bacterium]